MENKSKEGDSQIHVLVYPFPRQGHINPILHFSKRLSSKGLQVTFLSTISATNSFLSLSHSPLSINLQFVSTDQTAPGEWNMEDESLESYQRRLKIVLSKVLSDYIESQLLKPTPIDFIVYDSVMPWAFETARQYGIDAAPFFTQPCSVNQIFYHLRKGSFSIPLPLQDATISLPGLPLLGIDDLPFPCGVLDSRDIQTTINFMTSQFSNLLEPKFHFVNTFDHLENEVIEYMKANKWPIKTIGPCIPSAYSDGRLKDDDNYGLNLVKPDEEDSYIKWLDSKQTNSVVYISFGSLVILSETQVEQMAEALKKSKHYFLWVLRESELGKQGANFKQEMSDKGMVVNWCCQLQVLAHRAIGCFVTHCGWNSTIEAISLGVPIVAMPQWVDQTTNAKFIADVWKAGVRATVNEKGFVSKEEIGRCIGEVMAEAEIGKEMRHKLSMWKRLAKGAVDEKGSSDTHIQEFVDHLLASIVHSKVKEFK